MKHIRLLLLFVWMFPVFCLAQGPAPADDVTKLREQVATQQKQIDDLRAALEAQQKALDRIAASAVTTPVQMPPSGMAPTQKPPAIDEKGVPYSPLSFHIGGADFTPVGFMDFTSVFRSTNVGSGIGTSFGALPFSNAAAGKLTENRFSAQNSRIGLKVNGDFGKNQVTGYVEADFLGNAANSLFVTSNANTLRMRLYWVDLRRGKWEVLGGQSWSLLTPNRVGLSPMPSDIFYSQDMDTNYQVGLTWARQAQFRVVYHADKNWTIGLSAENPEQYVTSGVTFPSAFASQIDANGSATSVPNVRPDLIAKIAYDTDVSGKHMHVEVAGLSRSFKTEFSNLSGSSHIEAGGGSFNTVLELAKNFRFVLTSFYSSGGGRYIFNLGPDLIVRPDGTLSPVHSMSGIGGFEYQIDPKSFLYAYYGGAYFRRNYGFGGTPAAYFGFGFPGSTTSANREIQEPTFGYTNTFWKNKNYGALQLITQYSYVTRHPWAVAAGTPVEAHSHMIFADLRYVLP